MDTLRYADHQAMSSRAIIHYIPNDRRLGQGRYREPEGHLLLARNRMAVAGGPGIDGPKCASMRLRPTASQPGPVSPVMPDLDALTFPADLQDRPIASCNGQPDFFDERVDRSYAAHSLSAVYHTTSHSISRRNIEPSVKKAWFLVPGV